jgi:glycine/D-amino acid oxidase-like deaminating enzyme
MSEVNLSYWDSRHVSMTMDVIIVGAGITGLSCALRINQLRPDLRIRIIDKHHLTRVASTRNAGFVCFGSLTEIQDDIEQYGSDVAYDLVERRFKGIQLVKKTFPHALIDYHHTGGFELLDSDQWKGSELRDQMDAINNDLLPIIGQEVFSLVSKHDHESPFNKKMQLIKNPHEGQLNPSLFVRQLAMKLPSTHTEILAGVEFVSHHVEHDHLRLKTSWGTMKARQVILATNGLTDALGLMHDEIKPARNLVMVSEKMDLGFKGVYHAEKGYIYFRNIGDRLLIGGGRHWDKNAEYVLDLGENAMIKSKLKDYVKETIFPGGPVVDFSYQWSGIMGMTQNKAPIIRKLEDRLFLVAGFGGMGVALGMHSGFRIAEMACKENFN